MDKKLIKKNTLYLFIIALVILIISIIAFVFYANNTLNKKKKYISKKTTSSIPSSLTWGSDFNHDYKKIKKEKSSQNAQSNAFKYFKSKQ